MLNNKKQNNNLEKLKVIYGEVCEARRFQQSSIEHINNKINWFIVLDVVLIGFLFRDIKFFFDLLILIFLFVSLIILITTLFLKNYKTGPNLKDMLKFINWKEEKILYKIIKKNIEQKEYNDRIIKKIKSYFIFSFIGLLIGLFLLIFKILILCILICYK